MNLFDLSKKFLIFSGIGNPKNFRNILKKNEFKIIDEIIFPDHFDYKQKNIDYIKIEQKRMMLKLLPLKKIL